MKKIIGFTNYSLSCCGDVINQYGKVLKPAIDKDGYETVGLYGEDGHKYKRVSRLMAENWIPNPLNLPVVNHIDGNKRNNHVLNLEWCTQQQNIIHAHKTGLTPSRKGSKNGKAKLTEQQVQEIRSKAKPLIYTYKMLAKEYGVSKSTINAIIANQRW